MNSRSSIIESYMWQWIDQNATQLGFLIALAPIVWAAVQFLVSQRRDLKDRRFKTYHELVKSLVQNDDPDLPIKLDRQIAVVYELRNFREYHPVSLRILRGCKETWGVAATGPIARLVEEIDISIKYIERKVGNRK